MKLVEEISGENNQDGKLEDGKKTNMDTYRSHKFICQDGKMEDVKKTNIERRRERS